MSPIATTARTFTGTIADQHYSEPTLFAAAARAAGYRAPTTGALKVTSTPVRPVLGKVETEWLGAWVVVSRGLPADPQLPRLEGECTGQVWALSGRSGDRGYVWVAVTDPATGLNTPVEAHTDTLTRLGGRDWQPERLGLGLEPAPAPEPEPVPEPEPEPVAVPVTWAPGDRVEVLLRSVADGDTDWREGTVLSMEGPWVEVAYSVPGWGMRTAEAGLTSVRPAPAPVPAPVTAADVAAVTPIPRRAMRDPEQGKPVRSHAAATPRRAAPEPTPAAPTPEPAPADPTDGLHVGDYLWSSWGYDQTNVDFYRVEAVTAKTVTLQPWTATRIGLDGPEGTRVIPGLEPKSAPPMRRKVHAGGYVSVTDYALARRWDGRPCYQTGTGFGH